MRMANLTSIVGGDEAEGYDERHRSGEMGGARWGRGTHLASPGISEVQRVIAAGTGQVGHLGLDLLRGLAGFQAIQHLVELRA